MIRHFLLSISLIFIGSQAFAFHWVTCKDPSQKVEVHMMLDAFNPLVMANLEYQNQTYHYQHTEGAFKVVGKEQIDIFFTDNLVFSIAADGQTGTLLENQAPVVSTVCHLDPP